MSVSILKQPQVFTNIATEDDLRKDVMRAVEVEDAMSFTFGKGNMTAERYEELLKECYMDPGNKYLEPEAILSLNGRKIFCRGGIYGIGGQAGTRKTALLTKLTAVMLGQDESAHGFTKTRHRLRIAYFDTEQHPSSTQKIYERAVMLAGEESADYIKVFNLLSTATSDENCDFIDMTLQYAEADGRDFDVVVIDNWADCTYNVNELSEAMELCINTRKMAVEHEIAVIGVCHTNEGSTNTKLRGHAGSEFLRRSDLVMLANNKGDYSKITYPKTRLQRPDDFCITYVDNIPCFYEESATEKNPKSEDAIKESLAPYVDLLPQLPNGMLTGELQDKILEIESSRRGKVVSEKTAQRRVKSMIEYKLIEQSGYGKNSRCYRYNPNISDEEETELPF